MAESQTRNAAISNAIGRVVAEYTGRGPNSVRTTVMGDVVMCVMEDNFTKAEQSFVASGQGAFVKEMRLRFQQTMREDFERVILEHTGRPVRAFLSDHIIEPDIAVEIFILGPEG